MKQKGSSDVKGSLWNHLDKKVLLWHREAPLFLRVKVFPLYTMYLYTASNLHINVFLGQHVMKKKCNNGSNNCQDFHNNI